MQQGYHKLVKEGKKSKEKNQQPDAARTRNQKKKKKMTMREEEKRGEESAAGATSSHSQRQGSGLSTKFVRVRGLRWPSGSNPRKLLGLAGSCWLGRLQFAAAGRVWLGSWSCILARHGSRKKAP